MTLVRQRRHQQALKLSLPSPNHFHQYRYLSLSPPPPPETTTPTSPDGESLAGFKKLSVLGHGNGATVYKVCHPKSSSIYALKVLRFDQNAPSMNRQHQAAREAEIFKRVDSQYIVKCHAVLNTTGGELCFVMEHMERGSLSDALRVREKLSEEVISEVAHRVLKGLEYLHGMQIVHGDIKPSNLLISGKGEIKIADFGVSRINGMDSIDGTWAYMSPERWRGDKNADGFAGDVWAVGVVVLECLVGHYPLIGVEEKADWAALMCAICLGERLEMPEKASPEFRGFVRRCLEKDWKKRGTVDELLAHPFVNKKSAERSNGMRG